LRVNDPPGWLRAGLPSIWLPYAQMQTAPAPLAVAATSGVRIKLSDGRELIDGIASWWTACHGYNHPHIVQAIKTQAGVMPHVMFGGLVHEPALRLARRLSDLTLGAGARVFFSDSGSVAVEVALKMAVQYWINRGVGGRRKFVGFRGGYHGDTLATMAVGDTAEGMHRLFAGYLPEHFVVDLPRDAQTLREFDGFLAAHRADIAGVIIEPMVQGAGGMKFHDGEILAGIFASARRHGLLCIADEIFTGFGRTGSMFACAAANVAPDIMCVSKALTGGALGLAATIASAEVFAAFQSDDPMKALMHGPTYMANPLGCAAANASLDLFEREPRIAQARALAVKLAAALAPCRSIPGVADVRVMGAIGVAQLEESRGIDWLRSRFAAAGLWIRPFGDVVYLTPALTIEDADLDALTAGIATVLAEWSKS
jgi:adenosylmethionine-8-amino-7-oxononanoate aminotransferase